MMTMTSWFEHRKSLASSPSSLTIFVSLLFIVISLVFYLSQLLFSGFRQSGKQSISRGHILFNPSSFCLLFLTVYCLIA